MLRVLIAGESKPERLTELSQRRLGSKIPELRNKYKLQRYFLKRLRRLGLKITIEAATTTA